MKYVRPGYRGLIKVDRDLAVTTFREHESFYHPICRAMVKKDLKLDGSQLCIIQAIVGHSCKTKARGSPLIPADQYLPPAIRRPG